MKFNFANDFHSGKLLDMSEHISVFERIYFNESGEPVKWEKSLDRKTWTQVEWLGSKLPFLLLKTIPLPACIEREEWITEQSRHNVAPEPPQHPQD